MDHREAAVRDGFFFECSCGEIYTDADHAWSCRKCRDYLLEEDFDHRTVVDLRTGKKVSVSR